VATREAQSACRAVKQRRRGLGGAERADESYSFICYNGERAMRHRRRGRQRREKYKNDEAVKLAGSKTKKYRKRATEREREREREKKRRKVFLPLYDCRESLAYFTSPRKLLSLRCSRGP